MSNHRDTTIYLNDGLNVVVGDTDSGKSAIILNLEAVVYNGDMNVNWHETTAESGIEFADGGIIKRVRIEELAKKKCSCGYKFQKPVTLCPECQAIITRKKVDDYYEIDGERSKKAGGEALEEVMNFCGMSLFQVSDKQKISLNIFKKDAAQSFIDLNGRERMSLVGEMGESLISLDRKLKQVNDFKKQYADDLKESQKHQKYLQTKKRMIDDFLESVAEEVNALKSLDNLITEREEKIQMLTELLVRWRKAIKTEECLIPVECIPVKQIPSVELCMRFREAQRTWVTPEPIQLIPERQIPVELYHKFRQQLNIDLPEIQPVCEYSAINHVGLLNQWKKQGIDLPEIKAIEEYPLDILIGVDLNPWVNREKIIGEIDLIINNEKDKLTDLNNRLSQIDICPLCHSHVENFSNKD